MLKRSRWRVVAGVCLVLSLSGCAEFFGAEPAAPPPEQQAPTATPPPLDMRGAAPDRVRHEMGKWFAHHGYKEFQVAALLDHAQVESGYRPCAAGRGVYYTYQWSGERLQKLRSFARVDNRTCPLLEKQLAFTDAELRTNPNFLCFWRATTRETAAVALRRGFGLGRC